MARFLRLAVATLSVVGLSTATASTALADAASGAAAPVFVGCQVAIGADGMSLPSNAPALLVYDSSNQAIPTVSAELVSGTVRAALGAPTKDAHGVLIATLPTASAGTHTIETKVACSNGQADVVQETSLILTAPVEFPTSVGTLTLKPNARPTGNDTIVLAPSAGVRAFEPIAVVEVTVNGSASNSGGFTGASPSQRGRLGATPEFSVPTGTVCVENGALHREKRTLKVTVAVKLAGVAQSPAPATLDVEVDCGAIRWTSDSDFNRSSEPTSPTSEPNPESPGGPGVSSPGAGACNASPVGVLSGSSSVFAAAALALVAVFRRRRAR